VLQTPSRETGSSVLRRPLQYLYPLELYCNGNNADGTEDETSTVTDKTGSTESSATTQQVHELENRPKRAAAHKANDFIRADIADNID